MPSPFDTFYKDETIAREGVIFDLDGRWSFEYDEKKHTTTFSMKHLNMQNVQYEELKTRLQKPYLKRGEVVAKTHELIDIAVTLFVRTVLTGWDNLEETRSPELRQAAIEEHGLPIIPYNVPNAIQLFTSMPEFMDLLSDLAREPSYFQVSTPDKEKSLGNGFPPTTGGA